MSNEHARTENRSNSADLGVCDKALEGLIFGAQALPKAMDQGVSTFSHSHACSKNHVNLRGIWIGFVPAGKIRVKLLTSLIPFTFVFLGS